MARPAFPSNDRGLTLVETLVSLAILFVVFFGLMETARMAVNYNIRISCRDEAVRVAEEQINVVRSMPFDNVVTVPPANISRTVRRLNVPFRVIRTVTPLDTLTSQVNVRVSFDRRNPDNTILYADNSTSFTTILRRPATP